MNFLIGIGSLFNICGDYFEHNCYISKIEDDFKALQSDWENIGNDIKVVITKFKKENHERI